MFFTLDTVTAAGLGSRGQHLAPTFAGLGSRVSGLSGLEPVPSARRLHGSENKGRGISGGRAPSGGRRELEAKDKAPVPADPGTLGRQRQVGQRGLRHHFLTSSRQFAASWWVRTRSPGRFQVCHRRRCHQVSQQEKRRTLRIHSPCFIHCLAFHSSLRIHPFARSCDNSRQSWHHETFIWWQDMNQDMDHSPMSFFFFF